MKKTGEDLSRYIYSDQVQAIAEVVNIALASDSKTLVISDIDDSLLDSGAVFRCAINEAGKALLPDFEEITDEEVRDNGAKFCLAPSLIRGLSLAKIDYIDFVTPIYSSHEIHQQMLPLDGVSELLEAFAQNGFVFAGYLTARPKEIVETTAQCLDRHGLPEVPIIHAENKIEVICQILALLPSDFRIIILDDIVDNLQPVCEMKKVDDRVIPICLVSRHNQVSSQTLGEDVFKGTLPEIAKYIHTLGK